MKTFRDLQVGDLIFEIDYFSDVIRISKINEIQYFGLGDIYFHLSVVLGKYFPSLLYISSKELDNTIRDNVVSIVFANESDFLKAIENENI